MCFTSFFASKHKSYNKLIHREKKFFELIASGKPLRLLHVNHKNMFFCLISSFWFFVLPQHALKL